MHKSNPSELLYSEVIENHPGGQWIVFVHGAGGSVRTWKYQQEPLSAHFNLLLLDLRDHGNSQHLSPPADGKYTFELMARDIAEVMDARGIQQAHFVGVSLGSIVVRWFEELFPERVHSIAVAGGVFRLNFMLKLGLKSGLIAARILPFRLLGRLLSFVIMPRGNHQKARRIFLREADRIDPTAFKKWLYMARRVGRDLERFYKTPPASPMMAVMGSQDHMFLPPATDFVKKHPATKLHVLPNCGHVCNIEGAALFNRLTASFFKDQVHISRMPTATPVQTVSN